MKRRLDWSLRSHGVEILFEDESLIVLNKPAQLLVIPDRYNKSLASLSEILKTDLGSIFVVHRLDKETSGVLVFAKTAEAHAALNRQFEGREVEKIYHALVRGKVEEKKGLIELPLREDDEGVVRVDKKNGKESMTEYEVIEELDGYSMVELRPRTGRTHQIRAHLKAIGLPVLADPLYGDGKPFFLSHIKARYKSDGEEKPLLSRTALHASTISLLHPLTGQAVRWSAEMPKDMRSVVRVLRKYN